MEDTIVLFETRESLTQNMKLILDSIEWLKTERPEIKVKILLLPEGMKNAKDN